MISAYFEWKRLYINMSEMDYKYKVSWKKIKFTLFYWMELVNWENDIFSKVWEIEIEFNWQEEVFIDLERIETWYRWKTIWIGYYIKADFWKKMLILRDTKEIEISGREQMIFKSSELEKVKSWEYIWYKDDISKKEILNEIFKNYIKDLIFFIPDLLKKLFSWFIEFLVYGFIIALVLIISWIFSVSLFEDTSIFLWYLILIIEYLIIVFISSYVKHSKLWIEIKFNDIFNENINLNNIISWKTKKELNNIEIKVFWINQERGWYEYECGSSTCTAYINHTVWNVLLFSNKIEHINKWEDISQYLNYKLDIDKIYNNLFYSKTFSANMWLFVWIELRIISKKYKDIEHIFYIDLDNNKFKRQLKWNNNNLVKNNEEEFNNDFFE